MRHLVKTLAAIAISTLMACGGGYGSTTSPPPPPPPTANTILATPSLSFGPASLTINAGETVTFSFGSVAHNVFFDPQVGAPGDISGLNANVSVDRVFATPGTYHYTCHIHPSMHGTVVVN